MQNNKENDDISFNKKKKSNFKVPQYQKYLNNIN